MVRHAGSTGGEGEQHVVTGAFGFIGRAITHRLLERGASVRTLTGHPDRPDPFERRVEATAFDFEHPERMVACLQGAAVLHNTYWVRFPRGRTTYDRAVANTEALLGAARTAGVKRIVHVSIANPSPDSGLAYYRGKAAVEERVRNSGLSFAILRPTVVFGEGDVLINNIAWLVRHSRWFMVPGSGACRLQPVFVDDVAQLAVQAAATDGDLVLDAVGPEVYRFDALVRTIADSVGRPVRILRVPPTLAWLAARAAGLLVGDVPLTRDETRGLLGELLVSRGVPTAPTRLSEWLAEYGGSLGVRYASELQRHYR